MVSSDKKFKRRRLTLVICVIVPIVLYAGFVFSRNYKTYRMLQDQLEKTKGKYSEVQEKNEQLNQEVEYTKTDDYIVQKARELLGFVKPGEVKYVDSDD